MHIILESHLTDEIREKYIVLPLDTFYYAQTDVTEVAYCMVENTPISEMSEIEQWQSLHNKLIENYQRQNWKFCEDAVGHLQGKWGGELDSFYNNISERVERYKNQKLDANWTGTIIKE